MLEDERLNRAQAEKDRNDMQIKYNAMKETVDSVQLALKLMQKKQDLLEKDTALTNANLRNYLRLDAENKKRMDQLSNTTDRILDANLNENERLKSKIALQQQDLDKQKAELEVKIAQFEQQKAEYQEVRGKLGSKEEKIRELQMALDKKEKTVQDIQNKVSEALIGFKANGLNVETRYGKVYVLMPESLLFKSGSKNIDPKGKEALRQLALILNANPDINVNVEGHTDNVPYHPKSKSAMVEDNWDLSVLRATSVVKVLTDYGVSPLRVTAQGRGKFMPVNAADTPEARAQNRRTEIILSPKLDELLKAIE
jgi:chemotaxis protein MotB